MARSQTFLLLSICWPVSFRESTARLSISPIGSVNWKIVISLVFFQGNVHSSVEGLVETVLHSCNYHHFNMAVENLDDRWVFFKFLEKKTNANLRTTKLLNGQVGKHVSLKVENTVARDAVHLLIRPVDLVYDGVSSELHVLRWLGIYFLCDIQNGNVYQGSSYDSGCRLGNKEVLSLFKEGHSLMHFYVNISVDTVVTILKVTFILKHFSNFHYLTFLPFIDWLGMR